MENVFYIFSIFPGTTDEGDLLLRACTGIFNDEDDEEEDEGVHNTDNIPAHHGSAEDFIVEGDVLTDYEDDEFLPPRHYYIPGTNTILVPSTVNDVIGAPEGERTGQSQTIIRISVSIFVVQKTC